MRQFVLPLLALIGCNLASAQNPEFITDNSRRAIVPWSARSAAAPAVRPMSAPPSRLYHWAAFQAVIPEADQAILKAADVEILGLAGRPGPHLLYKIRLGGDPDRAQDALRSLAGFVNLLPVLPEEKVSAEVLRGRFQRGIQRGKAKVIATVFFHHILSRSEAEAILKGKVDEILPEESPYMVHVSATPERVLSLTELEEVARVEDYLEKLPLNDVSRDLTNVNLLQRPIIDTTSFPPTRAWNSGRPFTGDSVSVAVNEGVDMNHLDFRENTATGTVPRAAVPGESFYPSEHGTHVAGIIGGNGWNSELNGNGGLRYKWRGVAPKVLYTSASDAGNTNNHSFTNGSDAYYNYGDVYVDQNLSAHAGTRQDQGNVFVWSAANNGGYGAQYGVQRGYYSMLVNAKNAIKVGSVNPDGLRSYFSSMGPTRDGRVGPDVMAPGGSVYSAWYNSQGYTWMGGTSMSGPHVTGITALLLQKFRDNVVRPRGNGANLNDQPPWNSTLRAILVHTAQDMVDLTGNSGTDPDFESSGFPNRSPLFGAGPDFATGYGLVDAQRATQFVDATLFREGQVGHNQTLSYNITVPTGRANLRATLAWDDLPYMGANDATDAYANKLVNDLDIVLVSPTGTVIQPWILNHNLLNNGTVPADGLDPITPADIQNNPAFKGKDSRSNLEVVDVANPAAGTWRIEVRGFSVPMDQSLATGVNQDFSLVSDIALPAAAAPSGPDLVVSKLTWTPSRPVQGENILFRATLLNRGNQATPAGVSHGVGFYNSYSKVDSNYAFTQSLAPGQIAVLSSQYPWSGSASDLVLASADDRRLIAESNEGNNNLSALIPVLKIPEPWVSQDVGSPMPAGTATYVGNGVDQTYSLTAGGTDIWGTADQFQFLHRTLNGDGEIRAQVTGQYGQDPWCKAGVMIRESTAAGSRHAFMTLTVGNGAAFQYRATTGGTSVTGGSSTGAAPNWVRLVRTGNTFTGYKSTDGNTWTQVGTTTIAMGTQVRAGLALTSHMNNNSATADFASVSLTGGFVSNLTGRIADPDDNGIAGVTVTLSGSSSASTTTDATGVYTFANLSAAGNYTVTPTHASYTFSPANRTYSGLQLNRSADFFGTSSIPLLAPWTSGDIGSVGVAGTASNTGGNPGTFTLQGSGADIYGTADAFRFAHQALTGDGEIRARVASLQNTHAYAKAAIMIRDGLAANARHVLAGMTPTSGAEFVRRLTAGGTTTSNQAAGFAAPYWVRLTRAGNVFTAYRSPDGIAWTSLGTETIAMPSATRVGLAVTSHNNTVLTTGVFNEVSVLPGTPFQELDIGTVGVAGSRIVNGGGVQVVKGSGADIYGTADAFHFSYRTLTGDGEIKARVTALQNTHAYAKGAVMMRDGLAANARHVLAGVTPTSGAEFVRRLTAGGTTTSTQSAGFAAPYWVRLTRVGNVFTAYRSPDGVTWTSMGSETIAMPSTIQVGLAATSHNNAVLGSATFTNVQ